MSEETNKAFTECLVHVAYNEDGSRNIMFGDNVKIGALTVINDADARMATPLVNWCIRAYGWSELFVLRVLEGYKQFLMWKKSFEDWDGSTLSLSLPKKMMWQQHLLDSHNYQSDCMLLFGNLMHYDPDDGIEPEAESERIENTRRLASMRYREGDLDEQVWHWEEKKLEKPAHGLFSFGFQLF